MNNFNTKQIAEDLVEEYDCEILDSIMSNHSVDLESCELIEGIMTDLQYECDKIISNLNEITLDDVKIDLEYELADEAERETCRFYDFYSREDTLESGIEEEDFEEQKERELKGLVKDRLIDTVKEKIREALGY